MSCGPAKRVKIGEKNLLLQNDEYTQVIGFLSHLSTFFFGCIWGNDFKGIFIFTFYSKGKCNILEF